MEKVPMSVGPQITSELSYKQMCLLITLQNIPMYAGPQVTSE
jgi:hypothetical protein